MIMVWSNNDIHFCLTPLCFFETSKKPPGGSQVTWEGTYCPGSNWHSLVIFNQPCNWVWEAPQLFWAGWKLWRYLPALVQIQTGGMWSSTGISMLLMLTSSFSLTTLWSRIREEYLKQKSWGLLMLLMSCLRSPCQELVQLFFEKPLQHAFCVERHTGL